MDWTESSTEDPALHPPRLEQGQDDGVQGQEVGDDLLVEDDHVQGGVLGAVHSLGEATFAGE